VDFVRRRPEKIEIAGEKQAIIGFHLKNPLEGYRRLTFMMLDANIVATSPSSVWSVLGQAGLTSKWNGKRSEKGTGLEQPMAGTNRSKESASGRERHCRWKMRVVWWRATLSITTTSV
jgi:hypothetical protein